MPAKRPTLLLLLIAFVLPAARADVFDDVLERGSLRVGVAEFAPWTMRNRDGELVGFEIDLARKLAGDMGVRADIRVLPWNGIIGALEAGDIDVIAGGMAITPERALRVEFTVPVAHSGVGLATNIRVTGNLESLADLNQAGVTVVAAADTLSQQVAESVFPAATLRTFDSSEQAQAALLEGKAHAWIAPMPETVFLALRQPSLVDAPLDEPLLASSEALAVARGEQAMLNFLNAWITARQTDRWIPSTRDYWFRTLDWADEVAR